MPDEIKPTAPAPRRRPAPTHSHRGKIAAIATTVALAGLAGVALNSNRGMPAAPTAAVATHGHAPVVTRTSGATAAVQPAASHSGKPTASQPIVTRTSGVGRGASRFEDD